MMMLGTQKPRSQNRQTGMTLIEASIWFVLFALVIAGALKLYSSVSDSQTTSAITSDIMAIRSGAQNLFSGPDGHGSISQANFNTVLVTANRIPSTIKVDTTTTPYTLTNEKGGTVTIIPNGMNQFIIIETNLSVAVCTQVLINMLSQNFDYIVITGPNRGWVLGGTYLETTAAEQCAAAGEPIKLFFVTYNH